MIKTKIEDLNKTKNKKQKTKHANEKKNRFEVGKRRSLKGIIIKKKCKWKEKTWGGLLMNNQVF